MATQMAKEKIEGLPEIWFRDPFGTMQCSGCHYPMIQRIVAEVLEEMELTGRAIGNAGAGCASQFFMALSIDHTLCAHGRPPDVATGVKRLLPDRFVFTVQGDGDAIAIGTEPLIQAACRGERLTVIMLNNAGYGMTGGQMAPTTLLGMVTTTTSSGRDPKLHGYPIKVAELLSHIDGVVFSARTSVHTPAQYQRTKKLMKRAFQKQLDDVGFSFLEILSACPTDWRLTPVECLGFIENTMTKHFPPGVFKDVDRIEIA